MAIDKENMAVIIAALRYWQADLAADHPQATRGDIADLATNGGEFEMPDAEYIDDLCEGLNLGDFDSEATNAGLLRFAGQVARLQPYTERQIDRIGCDTKGGDAMVSLNQLIERARETVAKAEGRVS